MNRTVEMQQSTSTLQSVQTVVASGEQLWQGITVAEQILPPMQTGCQLLTDHLLMVVIGQSGIGEWRTGSDKWNSKLYTKGCVSVVPHNHENDARWDKEARVIYLKLSSALLQRIIDTDNIILTETRAANDPVIRHIVHALHQESKLQPEASRLYGEAMTVSLATYLAKNYSVSKLKLHAPKGKLSSTQLLSIIDYTNAYLDKKISIDDLAGLAHVSLFHFVRLFRNTLGISPYQYLLNLKIDRAKQLIKQNNYCFTEIAYLLGFTDGAHFANAFKKITGLSPSQFLTC